MEKYSKHWEIWEDCDGTYRYVRRMADLKYLGISIISLPEYCGRSAIDGPYWSGDLVLVDLMALPYGEQIAALRSCYGDTWPDFADTVAVRQDLLVSCCLSHGSYAPLGLDSGGDVKIDSYGDMIEQTPDSKGFRGVRKRLREIGDAFARDAGSLERTLDNRIVNSLGQTAREYGQGTEGLWSKLRDIRDDGDASDEQKLIFKMYHGCTDTLADVPIPADITGGE